MQPYGFTIGAVRGPTAGSCQLSSGLRIEKLTKSLRLSNILQL